ncbi:MAG: aromatic ring-hydroxylating dioxygenase subunit alpha [Polyangiaceae bacterium]
MLQIMNPAHPSRGPFTGFANVWTPVAFSSEVTTRPLSVRVAGTPVVLFRGANGEPAALFDRCPHRGVALSLGKVREGCLECPFHGWRFDGTGAAVEVPWNPDAKLERLHATALPCREIGGQIWIYTAVSDAQVPQEGPAVADVFTRPDVRVSGIRVEWNTHWTRAMENMLDWPHLPFVHAATIGKSMRSRTRSRMEVEWTATPWGAESHITIDGAREPASLDLRWPNQMNLFLPVPKRTLVMAVACVPVDETRTTLLLGMARDFLKSALFDGFFHRTNLKIATEDRAVVESSIPAKVPPPSEEKSVRTDALPLHFRKRFYAELEPALTASASVRVA